MLKYLEMVGRVAETVYEFLFWRDDWRRTWSPVSYWLAAIAAVTLLVVAAIYGRSLWELRRG
jgi:hypothetical protein